MTILLTQKELEEAVRLYLLGNAPMDNRLYSLERMKIEFFHNYGKGDSQIDTACYGEMTVSVELGKGEG